MADHRGRWPDWRKQPLETPSAKRTSWWLPAVVFMFVFLALLWGVRYFGLAPSRHGVETR